jgi:YVTN family beta-propeller protein
MKKLFSLLILLSAVAFCATPVLSQTPRFRALAFYSKNVEPDHVQFGEGAARFFTEIAAKDNFTFDATTEWDQLNDETLKNYQLVMWFNGSPAKPAQRLAFRRYIEGGGAWLGFHASGYNDKDTDWPWFVQFLGGAVFYTNSWPPLPAELAVDEPGHPVAKDTPGTYLSPANEWYIWKPSPRLSKDVQVLVTLAPSNYPIGLKDVLRSGDLPVVWTNKRYKMVYMNMGHGDRIFASPVQNKLIENAALWLGANPASDSVPEASGLRVSPHAVVANPRTNKVYAVNMHGGSVTVIDNARNSVHTIKVGDEPAAIAVNPVTNKIYVGNAGSGTVSVIDGATDQVTATVEVGALPYVVTANPVTNKIYVAKTFSNSVTLIDGATNTASSIKAGIQADAIAVNEVTNRVYLLNYESKDLMVIDGANDGLSKIGAAVHSWGIALNPTTNKIYLGNTGGSNLTVVDGTSGTSTFVGAGEVPCAFAVDSGANRVYAANCSSNTVTVLDGTTNATIATIRVGEHPLAIAVNPANHLVFVANTHSKSVSIIDGTKNLVLATVKAENGAYAIAVDPVANKAYAASFAGATPTVIDGKALTATPVVLSAKR